MLALGLYHRLIVIVIEHLGYLVPLRDSEALG